MINKITPNSILSTITTLLGLSVILQTIGIILYLSYPAHESITVGYLSPIGFLIILIGIFFASFLLLNSFIILRYLLKFVIGFNVIHLVFFWTIGEKYETSSYKITFESVDYSKTLPLLIGCIALHWTLSVLESRFELSYRIKRSHRFYRFILHKKMKQPIFK